MTINDVLVKWTYEVNKLLNNKPDDAIGFNLAVLKADTINQVLDDLRQIEQEVSQDFACDYLRKGESLNSMPRCLIRAYCDPRGCKDREVNTYRLMTKEQIAGKKIMISRPTQDQVESFWEDGDE